MQFCSLTLEFCRFQASKIRLTFSELSFFPNATRDWLKIYSNTAKTNLVHEYTKYTVCPVTLTVNSNRVVFSLHSFPTEGGAGGYTCTYQALDANNNPSAGAQKLGISDNIAFKVAAEDNALPKIYPNPSTGMFQNDGFACFLVKKNTLKL